MSRSEFTHFIPAAVDSRSRHVPNFAPFWKQIAKVHKTWFHVTDFFPAQNSDFLGAVGRRSIRQPL